MLGEPAGASTVQSRRRSGPRRAIVPRQRHVANAAAVQFAEIVERVLDGVAALDADQDRDLPLRLRLPNVACCGREEEAIRMTVHEGVDRVEIDLRLFP